MLLRALSQNAQVIANFSRTITQGINLKPAAPDIRCNVSFPSQISNDVNALVGDYKRY
jgi:hypothetical protein